MPYTTADNIQKAVGGAEALRRYSSFAGDAVDTDAIDKAIGMADSDIVTACGGRPGFTDAGFAAAIEPVSTPLALGYLLSNVWGSIDDSRFRLGFEGAKKKLEKMAEGLGALVSTTSPAVINASAAYSFGPNDELPSDYGRDSSLNQLKGL